MLSDFKKIWDFHSRTTTNCEAYFTETTAEEKRQQKLPKSFYAIAYRNMAEWMRHKATMTPPHTRDTMDPLDANYQSPVGGAGGQFMNEMDILREDAWLRAPVRAASTIDLTAGESPVVSSAQTHGGGVGNRGLGNAPTAPTHTASIWEINLNAPPSTGRHSSESRSHQPTPFGYCSGLSIRGTFRSRRLRPPSI